MRVRRRSPPDEARTEPLLLLPRTPRTRPRTGSRSVVALAQMPEENTREQLLSALQSRTIPGDSVEQQRSRTSWATSPTTGKGFGAGARAGAATATIGTVLMFIWHWRGGRQTGLKDYHSLSPPVSVSGKVWLVTAAALAAFFVASEQAVVGTEAREQAAAAKR